jgi:hypothetical protein
VTRAPGWLEALLRELAAAAPGDVLLVAPAGHALASVLRARVPATRVDLATDPACLPQRRYALALVAATLEGLDAASAGALLAALRDRLAAHVLVWADAERVPLDEPALRALGFRIHARDGAQLLCGFDLHDYKDRPDWLNPGHWAHPERWDKHRW